MDTLPFGETFYRFVSNAAGGDAELFIFDFIGPSFFDDRGVSARKFATELRAATANASRLTIHINSPGGIVSDGTAIANLIKSLKIPTVAVVDGWAHSIASLIAIAADRVEMHETALMMIHNPEGVMFGDATEMRHFADVLDTNRDALVKAYTAKSGKSRDEVIAKMDAETWFTADDAIAFGLADGIAEGEPIENVLAWDPRVFNYKNARPEYFRVSASPGAVFRASSMEHLLTGRRAAFDRIAASARTSPDLARMGFDIHNPGATGYGPPSPVMERARNAVAQSPARGKPTEGESMSTGAITDAAGLRGAYPQLVAEIENAARAAARDERATASAETAKAAVETATAAERKRVGAILDVSTPLTMEAAQKFIADGTDPLDAVVALTKQRNELASGAGLLGGKNDDGLDYGAGATAMGGSDAGASVSIPATRAAADGEAFTGAKKEFYDAVDAYMKQTNASEDDAIRAVRRANPKLHAKAFNLPHKAVAM